MKFYLGSGACAYSHLKPTCMCAEIDSNNLYAMPCNQFLAVKEGD